MSGRKPWTDEDTRRLIELHGQGLSLGATAKAMDKAKSTVKWWADKKHLDWDRAQTANAAAAVAVDNKAKRAQLEADLLDDAARLRRQLWEPTVVWNIGGANNSYTEEPVDKPTFADQRTIMAAVTAAATTSAKLAEANTDGRDLPAVDAWLSAMTGGG